MRVTVKVLAVGLLISLAALPSGSHAAQLIAGRGVTYVGTQPMNAFLRWDRIGRHVGGAPRTDAGHS